MKLSVVIFLATDLKQFRFVSWLNTPFCFYFSPSTCRKWQVYRKETTLYDDHTEVEDIMSPSFQYGQLRTMFAVD